MKSTFKTLFYLKKNEPKKNGHVVIMVRITVDGDQVQFSSKLDIHPDNWDTKTGKAIINKQSADKKENLRGTAPAVQRLFRRGEQQHPFRRHTHFRSVLRQQYGQAFCAEHPAQLFLRKRAGCRP